MMGAVPLVELWRGGLLESQHRGHIVISDAFGEIIQAWGDPEKIVFPRSSAKVMQALPLLESGAFEAHKLTSRHLALACASHIGAATHTDLVKAWISELGLDDAAFRCGSDMPADQEAMHRLICSNSAPCQHHNVCSGKHAGFLTVVKHLGTDPEYIDPSHPLQVACKAAHEDVTGETTPGFGVDGCSAPNFMTSLRGMARAMANYATAKSDAGVRQAAMTQIWQAMVKHPELVAGEGKACTELMRACLEPVALKYGAEGFYIAILPKRGLGVALKIEDGAARAAECAIAAVLVRLGALDASDPVTNIFLNPVIRSKAGIEAGRMTPAAGLL